MIVKMMVLKKKHDKDDEAEKKSTIFFRFSIVFYFDKEMFVLRGRIGALHQQLKLEQLFNNIGHNKNM